MATTAKPGWDTSRPVVLFRGGYRDGWCYFEADAEQERRSTEHVGKTMLYVPTDRFEAHPQFPAVSCRVWKFTG